MTRSTAQRPRRWLAPEVVQTSAMDCGPAALKCLLEGFHIPVSYGRLREACQTDIDGTSIDQVEIVAGQLGLEVEQMMVPADHLMLATGRLLPALVVVRQADSAPHFVVAWRRWRDWFQVMDPALGRRWLRAEAFRQEIYRHEMSVDAAQWRAWTGSEDFLIPLRQRLAALGSELQGTNSVIDEALADAGWFSIGALDASVRLVQSLVTAGGVQPGPEAGRLAGVLFRRTRDSSDDIHGLVPASYWSASPDVANTDPTVERLRLSGAVLLHVRGAKTARHSSQAPASDPPLSPELRAALSERTRTPAATIWTMLREDGLITPLVVVTAMGLATASLIFTALLFRGLLDISGQLRLPSQRLGAAVALLIFITLIPLIEIPAVLETLRRGRRLEVRLRMALLKKLPQLNDRYFQSRPITDMADRNHNIYSVRNLPTMGLSFVQTIIELVLTWTGIVLIAPDGAVLASLLALAAIAIPLIVQPFLNERDLRVRNHAAALHGFYLDALLGLAPVRAHRAERSVRRQHESLLVEWVGSLRGWLITAMLNRGLQAAICTFLAGWLLFGHFLRTGGVSGLDLLLIYWTLRLPAVGAAVAGLAQQYPAQRNVLLRMLEPLSAPEDLDRDAAADEPVATTALAPVGIAIEGGAVLAGGHEILRHLDLDIAPGQHVAVVGPSGAGKSSLIGLMLGWHRLAVGRLTVDGRPLAGREIERLRRSTAWVDPAIQIWNRSLLDNLEYAADSTELGRVGEVVDAARLRGVLEGLPRGLQSVLGEGGGMLSGGEGQRVRLGRALLSSETRLVLLDEPFRGMDRDQRRALLAEARQWWKDVTLICVTHDLSETQGFDRVLVIEGGRIVEDGAPAALAAGPTRYRDLLAAEQRVQERLWRGSQWRRLSMAGGRLQATEARP